MRLLFADFHIYGLAGAQIKNSHYLGRDRKRNKQTIILPRKNSKPIKRKRK